MARPLRKSTTDGRPYVRPPEIEAAIDDALALDAAARDARARIVNRKASGFLPEEALVHLIRDAKRVDDQPTLSRLFKILAKRCERVLERQVPDGYPHAHDIRADTLSELGRIVAEDETGTDPHRLDFFEIRFKRALLTLQTTIARKHLRGRAREVAAPDPESSAHEAVDGAPAVDEGQEPTELREEQIALFNLLPAADRKLLFLRFGNGIKVESNDAAEPTLAKMYGVTGRTIRNRIKDALARLAKLEKKA